jgi:hypothetical protein
MTPCWSPRRGPTPGGPGGAAGARLAAAALAFALSPALAAASPLEFVSPRDPLAAELRVLELYSQSADSGRFRLPHFSTWPLRRLELMGDARPAFTGNRVRDLAFERLERELERDATAAFAHERARRSTPRLFQRAGEGDERVELSAGVEGVFDAERSGGDDRSSWRDGSGLHLRGAAQQGGWLAFAHLAAARLRGAERFTDVLVSHSDLALQTEAAYLAASAGTRWTAAIGRQRFAWGPGEEGSLLLSRTAAPLTALWLHARFTTLRADAFALHATTGPGRGEQLAAHRLEWSPGPGLRVGLAEAARYRADGWQGVYLASVIPFSLAQRLLQQDGDTLGVNRNNVVLAADVAWRVADGTRVYAELLLDDLHAKTADMPDKYAWQIGLDGAWTRGFSRVTWNAEYTWLSRFVYTSFFGRAFTAQDAPLGFPTGPDARRLRTRVTWDPRVEWQLSGGVTRTWKGENGLTDPFVPGSPVPPVATLEGSPEVTDEVAGAVRWWPASGVDLAATLGWRRTDDAGHVAGAGVRGTFASLALRLAR